VPYVVLSLGAPFYVDGCFSLSPPSSLGLDFPPSLGQFWLKVVLHVLPKVGVFRSGIRAVLTCPFIIRLSLLFLPNKETPAKIFALSFSLLLFFLGFLPDRGDRDWVQ